MEEAESTGDNEESTVIIDSEIVDVDAFVAKALTTFDPLVKKIDELKESVAKDVYDLTTTKGNKAARSMRAKLKAIPGALEKAYTDWNQPRLAAAAALRARRDELADMIPAIIKPLDDQILVDEKRREDERLAKEKAEAARVGAIRQKITGISALVVTMVSESSEKLEQTINWLKQQEITKDVFEEFVDETKVVLGAAITGLETLRTGALAREESERTLAKMKADAEIQAEADRVAREERAAQDKIAADKAAADAEANRIAAEKLASEVETKRLEDIETAKRVAQEQQELLKKQTDAFEEERRVSNYIALINGRVTKVAMMTSVEEIEDELKSLREAEIEGATEDLRAQVTAALNESIGSVEKLLERAKATNAALDAQAQASAVAKAAAQEVAAPAAQQPAKPEASGNLEDALLDANTESAASQLTPEELAMQTIQETGGTARAPAYVNYGYSGIRAARQTSAPAEPAPELKAAVDKVIAAQRPSDWIILDTLATSFGVKHAEALEWIQDMDLFDLTKKVEAL